MIPNAFRHWRHVLAHRWRHDRRPFYAVGAVAAVLLAAMVAFVVLPGDDDVSANQKPLPDPSGSGSITDPYVIRDDPQAGASGSTTATSGRGAGTADNPFANLPGYDPDGLGGTGGSKFAVPHRLVLRVSSSAPIPVVGYQVPTSTDKPTGTVRDVGREWSLATIVYGKPDYARLFVQAGPTGAGITCTVTVDGKVRDQRTTQGPYGLIMCQG
ncbi:hypothetical protein [Nocardioides sp.]|uniref:hypothetical protein n=1 Tax=Nocardioides sp. TaxID=35761 RepID=UPI00351502C3